jgi:hypothetical protein
MVSEGERKGRSTRKAAMTETPDMIDNDQQVRLEVQRIRYTAGRMHLAAECLKSSRTMSALDLDLVRQARAKVAEATAELQSLVDSL